MTTRDANSSSSEFIDPEVSPTPAEQPQLVKRIADVIQERGRRHATGEPLFFDRLNLEIAIREGLAGVVPYAPQEKK